MVSMYKSFIAILNIMILIGSTLFINTSQAVAKQLFVSTNYINFDRCLSNDIPTIFFSVYNQNDEPITVELSASEDWILLSPKRFEAKMKRVEVSINGSMLDTDNGPYIGSITINSDGGNRSISVRIDIVDVKTTITMNIDSTVMSIDGKKILTDVQPFTLSGEIRIPLRIICESFHMKVDYAITLYQQQIVDYKIFLIYKDQKYEFCLDQNYCLMNGIKKPLIHPLIIRSSRAYITLNDLKTLFESIILDYTDSQRTVFLLY